MTDSLPPLDDQLLRRRLLGTDAEPGRYARYERMESVASTNQHLARALAAESRAGEGTAWPHLSVLTAEEQTGGRGRLGRVWASPKGASLSTSIVLRPRLADTHLGWLSMLAGRSLVDTLRDDFGFDSPGQRAVLKWPNDVQITQENAGERKISGILALGVPGAVVVGVGINVLLTREQLPTDTATSLMLELDRAAGPRGAAASSGPIEAARLRTELLVGFLERFARSVAELEELAASRPDAVAPSLVRRVGEVLGTTGQQVRVELPDGTAQRGAAVGLTPEGCLAVEVTDFRSASDQPWRSCGSSLRTFAAGDVVHLRRT